jgi:hypothetical protein
MAKVSKAQEGKEMVLAEKFDVVAASAELKEILEVNLGGEVIDDGLLDRVKVPAGGSTFWTVLDDMDDEQTVKELRGIILHSRMVRAFWRGEFTGTGGPPDCYSDDMETGIGDPGGECAICPLNEFGSDPNKEGRAKACAEKRILFVLMCHEDGNVDLLPTVIKVPPGSLRASKKYLFKLSTKAKRKMWGVVTTFSLEKDRNPQGQDFSRIVFKMRQPLDAPKTEAMSQYREKLMPILDQAASQMMKQSDDESSETPS